MSLSSEERRRRVHRAVVAQKKGASYQSSYRNDSYDDTGAQGRRSAEAGGDYQNASYRRPAGASMQSSNAASSRRKNSVSRQRNRSGRKRRGQPNLPQILLILLALLVLIVLVVFGVKGIKRLMNQAPQETETEAVTEPVTQESETADTSAQVLAETLEEAARLAAMYDYDAAIELLSADAAAAASPEAQAAIAEYEQIKTTLVRQDILTIPHVFYHILAVDADNAFDKSKWGSQADGYNSLMTTIPEFEKMLEAFYNDGFVLVGLHDMASMQEQPDGTMKMVANDIMLPPGKKALVMSQDDVCYYEYMEGAGFVTRMIVGEDGRPTCVYVDENGVEQIGDYDLVPILDRFIDEHPDFSYKGAKAIIALTGYNGILGYRTDETYDPSSDVYDASLADAPNENLEQDRETARQVIQALKDDGYEIASHSWGHLDLGQVSFERFKRDTDRWEKNVDQLFLDGECDILIFPKGADVGDWRQTSYNHETNEKFAYLYDAGFRYFCNVDNTQYWVQKGDDFLRQGRRALDGYNMWRDISGESTKLSDLFDDVSAIFDERRPTPVPSY